MFTTFTGTPSSSAKKGANILALLSVPPPAFHGTTNSTGPLGKSAAMAEDIKKETVDKIKIIFFINNLIIFYLLC